MAAKDQTSELLHKEPPAQSAALFEVRALGHERKLPTPILSGACAAEGWGPGKQITEAAFDAAVKRFLGAALTPRTTKAKEGEKS